MRRRRRLLILCTGNSARSQMAEGLFRHLRGEEWEVHSAGSAPTGRVRPEAVQALREMGLDISSHRSKHVDEFADGLFDVVLTVCDHAAEACPVYPAETRRIHWPLPDPQTYADFLAVRDELLNRIKSHWD